jgi:predicted NAD/FAD-binding protein
VPYENSAMSFSVKDSQKDFEYNGTNLNALFAQRKNLISLNFSEDDQRNSSVQ